MMEACHPADAANERHMLRQIYSRLTLIATLLMVVAIVAIGLSLERQKRDALDEATRAAGNIATILAQQTTHSVQSIDIVLRDIADRVSGYDAENADPAETVRINHFLRDRLAQLSQADVVSISDRNGKLIASTRGSTPSDITDREFFNHHRDRRDTGLFIARPMIGRITGAATIFFSRRIEAADGTFLGVAVAGVQPEYFLRTGDAISSIPGETFVLLDTDGYIYVRHPSPLDRTGLKMPLPDEWRAILARGGGAYRSDGVYSPAPRSVAVRPLRDYPLVVNVAVVEAIALQDFNQRAIVIVSVALMMILGFSVLLRLLLKQFRRAIESDAALREREARLQFMAQHDFLTGLANRALFVERLEELFRSFHNGGPEFCVLLIDLDQFKDINDSYGHKIGDEALVRFAEDLKRQAAPGDLAARLGGDEFAIIRSFGQSSRDSAVTFAERLLREIRTPFVNAQCRLTIGASVGLAFAEDAAAAPGDILRNADLALYQAKADGRSCFRIFEPAMQQKVLAEIELTNDLREALNRGALTLDYQPIFNIAGDEVAGMEALARWRHPVKGNVPPTQFVALAEKAGLIGQLGEFVLDRACRDARSWPPHVRVAVNVSAIQISQGLLVQAVQTALNTSGLNPRQLEIEITESAIMGDDETSLRTLRELRALGVGIALDDFGTGFSSLSYLSRFPIDKIKIDRSFTANIDSERSSIAIISATASIARALDIRTTAEGVETEDQLFLLRAAGIDEAQGYLIGRPAPLGDWRFEGKTVVSTTQPATLRSLASAA